MRFEGRLTNWNDGKGFGFIDPSGGGEQVFVHISAFANRRRRPVGNERVTYEVDSDGRGRTRAKEVAFIGGRSLSAFVFSKGGGWLFLAGGFLVLVAVLVLAGKVSVGTLGLYLGLSVVTFVAYGWDKSAARNDRWRTRESTLHLLALAGGWPGALTAQKVLRHKSRKQSFQVLFWLTVALNCGLLVWLLVPTHPGG